MPTPKLPKPLKADPNPVLLPGDKFVDTVAAGEILDTPPNTLVYWRCIGCGPKYYKHGNRAVRYLISDLIRFGTARAIDPQKKKSA